MSTIATTYTTTGSLDSLGRSVMTWLRALVGATPATLAASSDVASYYKVGYRMALLRRANELAGVSPRRAAELRKLAAA